MSLVQHQAINVYLALRFFSALFFAVIVTVNLVYQASIVGLNPLQLVLVGTLLEATIFFFEIPTGIVADLYSRKLSIMIGVFLIGLGFVVEGAFPYFFAVLIAQVIWGIGYTFVSGAREAWIADEVGEERAGVAFTKGTQMSLLGALIGIALSIGLANIDIRLPIILGGMFYSLQSVYVLLFMPENNFHPTPVAKRESFKAMKHTFLKGIRFIKLSPVLLIIIITGLIYGVFSEGFDRLWTPFMLENFQFPEIFNLKPVTWFGVLAMGANILSIGVIQIAAKKTDTFNHKSTVTALFAINGLLVLSLILFGLAHSFILACIGYWLVTMFKEARNPFYDAWVNQNLEPKIRATIFSMCDQANSIGQIVGGPLLGLIATLVSLRLSLVISGIVLIPTLLLFIFTLKKHKLAEPAYP